jgi:hypothetical protein
MRRVIKDPKTGKKLVMTPKPKDKLVPLKERKKLA